MELPLDQEDETDNGNDPRPGAFGYVDHYFASATEPDFGSDSEAARFFRKTVLGEERANDLREEVTSTVDRWRTATREKIRTATKLKFSYDNDNQERIPVSVQDGVPPPFQHLYQEFPRRELWQLLVDRSMLETTIEGLREIGPKVEDLRRTFKRLEGAVAAGNDFDVVREFLEDSPLLKGLRQISVDTLGAYYFRVPAIHLHWLPIAIVANTLSISVEALTVVVLLHERAHAYTHRGFDTDGNQWPTSAFARTDLEVVEGLAQYYTWAVCRSVEDKRPSLLEAFERVLTLQPEPYHAFFEWRPEAERAGEIIRSGLINTRARPILELHSFRATLHEIRMQQGAE
jgi:hypothetical protein